MREGDIWQPQKAPNLVGDVVHLFHAKRHRHALHCTEGVHQYRHFVALNILEKQRHIALALHFRDTVCNLGNLQRTVHLGLNPFQQSAFFQCRYELPQILERQNTSPYCLPLQHESHDEVA